MCLVVDIIDKEFSSTVMASYKHRFWNEVEEKKVNDASYCMLLFTV